MSPKRIGRTVLCCSCVLSMVLIAAGCTGTGKDAEGSKSTGGPVTYNMFRNAAYIVGYPDDGGPYKQTILDAAAKAGIKDIDYKITISGGAEYFTKLNVLSASDNLPDYFSVDIPTMIKYADEGLILPLDDLMKKNAPHLTELQNKGELDALRYKGKIWAIFPGYRPEVFNGPSVVGYNIRTDWLDAVGMKMPANLEELHNVLKAFTDGDPDKNGKKDTIGLTIAKTDTSGRQEIFSNIFGAFGIQPTFWLEKNGKLQKGFTLPETKEALKVLRDWYKEGIIDPDFPVNEAKQVDEKVANSKVGVWLGSALDVNPTTPRASALAKTNPNGKIGFLPPPAGPQGLRGGAETAPGYGDLRAISAKAKDPERLVKLIDWSADQSDNGGFALVTYGKEGEHYTYDKATNILTQKANILDLYKLGLGNPVRFVQVVDRRWVPSEDARKAISVSNQYITKNAYWKTTPTMFDYPDLESKLWPEYALKIILGQLPVEAWDEFVKKYYEQGGKAIEDEVNKTWKAEKAAK
jgi:putative aldouronate transport system substrate-binding protein